jgi:Mrp family chromosome partitioning ATPase
MADSEQVLGVLRKVLHPEIKRSLVDLGMIKGVGVQADELTVTLALPFQEIPIRDELISSVRQELQEAFPGQKTEVKLVEMSQRERAAFMAASEGGPRPAQSANRIDRVIAVLSGKGGVGKSSVAALLVVAKAAHMARQMKAPILGLIENMSYLHCPRCSERIEVFGPSQAMKAALKMGVPLLGELPLDPELARQCDSGQIEAYAAESFQRIADAVEKGVPATKTKPIL